MKRKLAVLLAGVMTIASMPMNVFVAAPIVTGTPAVTRLSRSVMLAPSRTAFVEAGTSGLPGVVSGEVINSDEIQHWIEGGNFNIVFQENHPTDTPVQFTLDLDNAEWFFRNVGSPDIGDLGHSTFNPDNGTWDANTRIYTRTANGSELAYTLQVSAGDASRATVTITAADRFNISPANGSSTNSDVVEASAYIATEKENKVPKEKPEGKLAAPTVKPEVETKEAPAKENKENKENKGKLEIKAAPTVKPEVETKEAPQDKAPSKDKEAQDKSTQDKAPKVAPKTASAEVYSVQVDGMTTFDDGYGNIRAALGDIYDAEGYIGNARTAMTVQDQIIEHVETPTTQARVSIDQARNEIGVRSASVADAQLDNAYTQLGLALGALTDMEDTDNQDPFLTSGSEYDAFVAAIGSAEEALGFAGVALNAVLPVETGGVRNGEVVSIPLVVRTLGENVDASIRVSQSNPVSIQTDRRIFAQATQVGLTTTSIATPRAGRDRIEISAIGIFENRIGALPTSGTFELVAPSGYHFANVSSATLGVEGGVAQGGSWTYDMDLRNDATVLRVEYSGLGRSTNMTGTLVISNLALIASNADSIREGDIYLDIRNVGSPAVVSPQRFLAGTVSDWGVNMISVGEAPQLVNGRLRGVERTDVIDQYHRAATVRVEERIENAWWAQRSTTFTLPEQVKVRKVEFRNVRNVSNYDVLQGSFYNDRNRAASANVRVNDNIVTLTGLQTSNTSRASFEMDLWLNIESGFEGDINLVMGGSAITDDTVTQSVKIASAVNPIELNVDVTNVRLGYQFIPVGDFSITENVPGALLANEQVFISLTDNMFSDMQIVSGFDWDVTRGDLRVRNMRTGTNLGINNNNNNNNVNLSFEIDRQSTEASEITFSNVQVRSTGNAPISNQNGNARGYDLVVWGPAIAANFEGIREEDSEINRNDFFREAGVRVNFVNVEGGTNNNNGTNNLLTNIVKVTANSPIIRVDDRDMVMDTAPFVSAISDSMMVPVRFVSMGLGIDANRVLWSPDTSTVTIDAGERILQFQTNSSIMRINGIEVPMLNANGEPVYSEVRDERAFIPFRALANALNIAIDWDPTTATATFDPTRLAISSQNNIGSEGRSIAYYGNYNQNQSVTPIQNRTMMNSIQRSSAAQYAIPNNSNQVQNRGIINRAGGIQTRTPSYVLNGNYTQAIR